MTRFLTAILDWLREGYPDGIPPTDHLPVLALLSRRLTSDEVKLVAQELMQRGDFDHIDIGVAITQITDEMPNPEDIKRMRATAGGQGLAVALSTRPRTPRPHRQRFHRPR